MADNIQLNAGSGGAVLAADDIASVFYQIVKIAHGAADSATMVSTANPLPVDLRTDNLAGNIDVNLAASAATVTVTGTVAANAGSGTFTTSDLSTLVDDAAFSPASTRVTMIGATFDNVTPDSVDEGDAGAIRMSANRNLFVNLRDAAGNERGLNVDAAGAIAVTDGAGSLTVDNPTLSVTGGGVEGTALRVTLASDSTGVLSVDDNGASLTVDGTITANAGTGTFATSDTATMVDDAAFTPGTGRVLMVGAEFDDAAPDSVNEGDGGAVRMSANRNLYTTIRDAAGNERGVNVDATNRLSVSVDNTPAVTISSLPNENQQTMANSISVAIASDQSNVPVSQATASALNAQVIGAIAHDASASGSNPLGMGGVARTANPTAVAAGDRADLFVDDLGKAVVYPIAPRDRLVAGTQIALTSTTETTLIAAGGAGVFRDLAMLMMSNESATEVRVDFRDVAAGTVLFSIDLAADGGGAVVPFRVPWPQATANSAWTAQLSAAVSTVYISGLAVENN